MLSLFVTQIICAQDNITPDQLSPIELTKITATETTSYFGNSVSLSQDGSVLAVGEYGYGTTTRVSSGRVQVYTNETGNWLQKGQDLVGIEDSFNAFGKKVVLSSDGNTLAVYDSQIGIQLNTGETLEDKYGSLAPEYFPYIQVYEFNNGTWTKIGADFLFDDIDDYSDMALSGDGTSLAIATKSGTKIYLNSTNTWTQTGLDIPSRDELYDDKIDLSEDGNTIIIGDSYYSDSNSIDEFSYEGQAKVYQKTSNTWSQLGSTINGTDYLGYFGSKVSISADGETIAIGTAQTNNNDYIAVLELSGNNWISKGTNISQVGSSSILSMELSNDGNAIVIGEAYSARVLKYDTDWQQVNTAFESDEVTDEFAHAVSISGDGNHYAVGAPSTNSSGKNGYVSVLGHNKNYLTRFGDEIYGYGTYNRLGKSVAVSENGNIIAVGAYNSYNDSGTYRYAHVRVFEKTNTGLLQIGADIRNTTDFDSGNFGSEIELSADGNLLAVSAPSLQSNDYGAVYIYKRTGNNWLPLGNVISEVAYSRTGTSISFSNNGKILAIGSPGNGSSVAVNEHKGYTTVYKYNNTNDTWESSGQKIIGEAAWNFSGGSVDLSGDGTILAIGAIGNDAGTPNGGHGHARVFEYINNTWVQLGSDIDGASDFNINFGGVVKLSNDGGTLIVSDLYSESGAGSVEIFNWDENTTTWEHDTQLKTYTSSGPNSSHRYKFGEDITMSNDGKILVIGEYEYKSKGKVHIYTKDDSGTWLKNQLFLEGTHNGNQYYGGNLSLSGNGNTLVVGSSGHNENGTGTGMAAVYHLNLCSTIDGFETFNGVETTTITPSANLIENGGAEILPVTDNGWTSVIGQWEWTIRNVNGVSPQEGHKYFKSTANGIAAELYQDVDVTAYSATIDAGHQYFYFSAYQQSFRANGVKDDAQVIVEYRNQSGDVLATYDTGLSQVLDEWALFEDTRLAPVGTKTIRVRILEINNNPYRAPLAYIDNVFLSTTVAPNAVSIIDPNFEQYLIDENIDSDGVINGQVLRVDVENVTKLFLDDLNIANLTGIEAFNNLVELTANNNQITSIDLSHNLDLEILSLANNQLSSLVLTNNLKLKNINVGENLLTTLDIHLLTDLENLTIYKNQFTEINLFSNKNLRTFIANQNQLKTVDVNINENLIWLDVEDNFLEKLTLKNSNNSNILVFNAKGNLSLSCIEVDDATYSENNWENKKDVTADFSEVCSPANDYCEDAVHLFVGQQITGDIDGGSVSTLTDDCVDDIVIADVWYNITVPNSGELIIDGTSNDGLLKLALYDTCTSLISVACGENISLENLTPGVIYYLRVWLEDSTSNRSISKASALNSISGSFTLHVYDSNTLSVSENEFSSNNVNVYPNPVIDFINVTSKNLITSITVFNLSGQQLFNKKPISTGTNIIDVSQFKSGLYLLKIDTETASYTKKILIK